MSQPGRVLLFGPGGSGKSVTAMLLAIGRSIHYHDRKPIALVDPENVEEFLRPLCKAEGIELLVEPSRSFVDMRDSLRVAEDAGCGVFLVDHYDGIHRELTEAQKTKLNLVGHQLPYAHREELIRLWDSWVRDFRASKLDAIFTGRQAWSWGDAEDAAGDPIKVKLGTKARGDADADYEPNLLIEMERLDNFSRDKLTRSKKGRTQHVARIVKDRAMTLNGLSFVWKDLNGYKAGDYAKVWEALAPHFAHSNAGPRRLLRPEGVGHSSAALFDAPAGESRFIEAARRRTIAIEEIQGVMATIWPGTTNDEKRLKHVVMMTLFNSRSWTAIELMMPEKLEDALKVMNHFEDAAKDISVKDESAVIACLQSCKDLETEAAEQRLTGAVL